MIISILTSLHLLLGAYFFTGASFDFADYWGIFSLITNEDSSKFVHFGIILCFCLILLYSIVSKMYPNSLIPSLVMSFEPILSTIMLQIALIQFMPGAFGCIGYIFILLGNFLILIGQWMYQRIHKKEENE